MKIMIHSNAPWVPSGYGTQTALLARKLKEAGHEVTVSAFHGLSGAPLEWEGITVLPAGEAGFGLDVLIPHAERTGAELVITLMDTWKLAPIAAALDPTEIGFTLACWTPVDCEPISRMDLQVLKRSGAKPLAVSRFGFVMMREAGLDPVLIPHAVDLAEFYPEDEQVRKETRFEQGFTDDDFVIGINAANHDALRKGFSEQFLAFSRAVKDRPELRLLVHTRAQSRSGPDLLALATELGIGHLVTFTDSYAQMAGVTDTGWMRRWYSAIDLLSACSYAEGFGLPLVEASACDRRTVATDGSAMTENARRLIPGTPYWNPAHLAWWNRPDVDDLEQFYSDAKRADPGTCQDIARELDIHGVFENYWVPFLESL